MQYVKTQDGKLNELTQKNVDFGGGLERMAAATINNPDVFQTDLYSEIISTIEEHSHKKYIEESNRSYMQVISDHLKAAAFLIQDGVVPSNKTQGYVLRRLLRRAAVKTHQLRGGLTPIPGFLAIGRSVLKTYDGIYFNLNNDLSKFEEIIDIELSRFASSLDRGLKQFDKLAKDQLNELSAFNLYQTYGFPYEITEELFKQKGQGLDRDTFNHIFARHRELSRTTAVKLFKGGLADHSEETTKLHTATHLLHQALRTILGMQISQKGSNITAERLRFDFSYPTKLTQQEISEVENLVNEKIAENLPVSYTVMDKDEALRSGALAFFGERYADRVKVYTIGNFSKEICGGPHVAFTGTLGHFTIVKAESAGSGIRRIYAVVSPKAPDKSTKSPSKEG
jgi:alanyl-tRNA synthetase